WQEEFLASPAMESQRAFWRQQLSGELPILNLFTDKPRPPKARFQGARQSFYVDEETTLRLRKLSKETGCSLFMTLLAAYQVFLSCHTGQEDIIVGVPVLGRTRGELQDMAGAFINTLPMRGYPKGELTFRQYADAVRQDTLKALEHQDVPLERMVADLGLDRDDSRNPLYDTMLVMGHGELAMRLGGAEGSALPFDPGVSKLDLTLEVFERKDELYCQLEYNTALFSKATALRMVAHWQRLLELILADPDAQLKTLLVHTPEEYYKVTEGFNKTDVPLDPHKHMQDIFEKLADTQPDKTALIVGEQQVTFAQLEKRANRIAHALRRAGIGKNSIVALMIHRSVDLMAALLAVWKAGGGYLPLDPTYPLERVSFMLSDCGADVLLVDDAIALDYKGCILDVRQIPEDGPDSRLAPVDESEDACYIIYTSGSTGVPKGALLPRRAMLNLYEACRPTIDYRPDEVSVSVTTVSFDIFVIDAIMPLLYGLTVVMCTEEELRQPHLLADLIERTGVTFIQTTPTRMRIFMDNAKFRAAAAGNITKVVLGGEEFPLSLLRRLKRTLPKARIISGYGPTETTVYCTFKDLTDTQHITIGRSIDNTRMYILDAYGRPTPMGVLGEAYISGACVAKGYIGREELTRQKYTPDPFCPGNIMYQSGDICCYTENGEMEIRGRVDHQVKIRGLRIELGEIEAALRAQSAIEEAVVLALSEGSHKYLCAYYAAAEEQDEAELRKVLGAKLPNYMVPSYFVWMKEFPLTVNGKINRKELRPPEKKQGEVQSQMQTKLTPAEKKMARVWQKILGVGAVEAESDFFALGGDSLGVIQVQAAILAYGWSLTTQDFYDRRTLRSVCQALVEKPRETADDAIRAWEGKPMPRLKEACAAPMGHVVLTGATGYLGAHLLWQLLEDGKTKSITCLVRGDDPVRRMDDVLTFYFGSQKAKEMLDRTDILSADVTRPNFGLKKEHFAALAEQTDTLLHAAALTDHVGRREAFEKANVEGTARVVDFCRKGDIFLLHISTISVAGTALLADPAKRASFTEEDIYIGQNCMQNEYARSKTLAEQKVITAVLKGKIKARIFRVGLLTARYSDGRFQQRTDKNAFANRLRALTRLGLIPRGMWQYPFEMTPVDACAKAICLLAAHEGRFVSAHVASDRRIDTEELCRYVEGAGYNVKISEDEPFCLAVSKLADGEDPQVLMGAMEGVEAIRHPETMFVDPTWTSDLLRRLGFTWPKPNDTYLRKFLKEIL
ncbi:MAG: amino acid adenylation domain-containing protein, partial [Christensenellaceae bacterium]|nr:amino acid adenylation domain-containing protein [Christensenellaceae bacterium]